MPYENTQARSLLKHSDGTYRGGSFFPSGPGRTTRGPKPPHGIPNYTQPVSSRKIDSNSTAVTINNSTVETTVVSVTAPALTIRSQGATRLTASGTIENIDAGAGELTMKVKVYDGTTTSVVLATTSMSLSTSANKRWWNMETLMYGVDTNEQAHWGSVLVSQPTTSTLTTLTYDSVGYSTSNLDDLEPLTITVTAQLTAASTDYTFVMESAVLEAITG